MWDVRIAISPVQTADSPIKTMAMAAVRDTWYSTSSITHRSYTPFPAETTVPHEVHTKAAVARHRGVVIESGFSRTPRGQA